MINPTAAHPNGWAALFFVQDLQGDGAKLNVLVHML